MNDMTDNKPDESLGQNSEESASWAALRESKGISLEDIAQQTNISMRKLEALERKDFEALGAETFALGYLRRYAKIIDVDAQIFIDAYKASNPHSDTNEMSAAKLSGREFQITHYMPRKIPLAAIAIVIFIIWVGVMLMLPDNEAPERSDSNQSSLGSEAAPATEEAAQDVTVNETAANETNEADTEQDTTSVQVPVVGGEDVDPVQNNELNASSRVKMEQSEVAEKGIATKSVSASNNLESVPADARGQDVIVMNFTDDCWVEIKNAQEEVIFAQLQTKEDNLQIFGQAPFFVMLGNARAATVSLNGKLFSTTPPDSQNTFRLTLSN